MISKRRVAIFLAGGEGRRMGRDKPTLELGGESLVQRHLRQSLAVNFRKVLIVTNRLNRSSIEELVRGDPRVQIIEQKYPGASGAVKTGLEVCVPSDLDEVFIVCVNDIVTDEIYSLLASCQAAIAIPTVRAQRVFRGGMLELCRGQRIATIVERTQRHVPVGAWINIFIHRICGPATISSLYDQLLGGIEYEKCIQGCIQMGHLARPVFLRRWVGIKTPSDFQRALGQIELINTDRP